MVNWPITDGELYLVETGETVQVREYILAFQTILMVDLCRVRSRLAGGSIVFRYLARKWRQESVGMYGVFDFMLSHTD